MKHHSISDCYALDEKIEWKNRRIDPFADDKRILRVAILGNFTLSGVKETLNVKCDEAGLILKSYVGPYNQYNQELLNRNSQLYDFNPHITILFLDLNVFLGEDYYFPYRLSDSQRRSVVKRKAGEISNLADAYTKRSDGKLILHNFVVPNYSPMGISENKQGFGFFEMTRELNQALEDSAKGNPKIFIFDYDGFVSRFGKARYCDEKMRYLADMRIGQNLIPALCDEYMRYIKALKARTRKCIVLDLDNTLWGGVVGEDGFDGIKLSTEPPGNLFVEFQKRLLALFYRGMILAINSSNNAEDAMKVIREHPSMILRERHFAAIRINWDNKAKNMVGIAKELNIGLDSMIYVDDDKTNRQLIGEIFPQILILELPEDQALYARTIEECEELDALQITEEDKRRGLMYAQERHRAQTKKRFDDVASFLKNLDIRVGIERVNDFSASRIAQLTQRTNQFNFSARRHSEEDIRAIVKEKNFLAYAVSVRDRFGDSGISGAVIMRKETHSLILEDFLLSCRVLGKGIEKAVMAFCFGVARKTRAGHVACRYVKTDKNYVAGKFLRESGFKIFKKDVGNEFWRRATKRPFKNPQFIKVTIR